MNKFPILLILCLAAMLFTGCYDTYYVASYNDYYSDLEKATLELYDMGYKLTGKESKQENKLYAEAVSYSTENGFGTAMQNDYINTDKYVFKDNNGNQMSYSVSYKRVLSDDDVLCVMNVNIPQCETSNPNDFARMCGDNSPIRKLSKTSKKYTYSEVDNYKTILFFGSLSVVLGLAVVCILL